MAKFHESGAIQEVTNRSSAEHGLAKISANEEKDAIIDIYNYCARFDMTPNFDVQAKQRNVGNRGRNGRTHSRIKTHFECTVELPQQGIKALGVAADSRSAEVRAALAFKTEAERYHKMQGSDALIIKDSTALTVESASKWMDFYRIVRPGVRIDIDLKEIKNNRHARGSNPFQGQVMINDEPVGEPVVASNKDRTSKMAMLTAAVTLKVKEPALFPRYIRALELGNGQILKPIAPIDMNIDEDCSLVMRETLLAARRAGLPDEVTEMIAEETATDEHKGVFRNPLMPYQIAARSSQLKRKFDEFQQKPELAQIRAKKADLPMNQYKAKVLDLINKNMYSIVVGATGSGKTTQVPQILLEEAIAKGEGAACNIVCTQPRRIAAVSVARRVAEEKAERLQESVGYHVRFDSRLPKTGGSITYCTTGILLQQLQHMPDDVFDNTSHLVVDEVHERDMLIDFLLILLKKKMMMRKAEGKSIPKVVLMSATMDTELFASYFKTEIPGQEAVDCPFLSVPGRTFPVKEKYIDDILKDMTEAKQSMSAMHQDPATKDYLESEERFRRENSLQGAPGSSSTGDSDGDRSVIDWKRERKISSDGEVTVMNEKENALVPIGLIACTVAHIARATREGAVLVFLPGLEEILKVEEALLSSGGLGVNFNDSARFKVYKLHSSIADAQTSVFEPVPEGCRKIILSTNIAETSVTIPDVQHVVDTGKLREKQYDQMRRITMLLCTWISKSNSKQRAGRAGRVQNGNYYALYSKERYDSLRAIGLPELLRSDLQEICLDVKSQAFGTPVREFLAEAIEPPAPKAVDASVINLQALDALTDSEEITPLGRLLASLPVHPTLGKMIVLGIIFRCLDPMLILGAASAERPLFVQPLGLRDEANRAKLSFVEGSGSDHIALLNAVRELRRVRDYQGEYAMRDFATRNFLHFNAFRTIDATAKQIEEILVSAGLIPHTPPGNRARSQFGDPSLNENSHKIPLIKGLVLSGTHPNLAVNTGGRAFRTPGEKGAILHPSSTNAPRDDRRSRDNRDTESARTPFGTIYSYSTMAKSNDGKSIFLRETSESTPLIALLFGGKLKRQEQRSNIIELDNWLPFFVTSSDRRTPQTLVEFRKALERLLVGAFRELGTAAKGKKMDGPKTFLADEKVRELFAGGLVEVLDRDVRMKEGVRRRGWGAGANGEGGRYGRR